MDNLSIDFYSKTEAAVSQFWPNGISSGLQKYLDSLMLTCYIFRNLRNMGNHPVNDALILEIKYWNPVDTKREFSDSIEQLEYPILSNNKHILFNAAVAEGVDFSKAQQMFGQNIYLVTYKGKGEKRFCGEMGFKNGLPIFILKIHGFGIGGILGIDIPFYAPDSILHFLTHLYIKYHSDKQYHNQLKIILHKSVETYQRGFTNIHNQELLATKIVQDSLPASIWMQ